MPLSERQKRYLKALAHRLKPVVTVGQLGLRDSVLLEIDTALSAHELLKTRINASDRGERASLVDQISLKTQAEVVQRIGHVAVFFRRNQKKPQIALPNEHPS